MIYPAIGDVPLADLKRSHVIKMLDDIEDQCGIKMSDLTLAYIRRIFSWHESRTDEFTSPITRSMVRYDAKASQGTRVLTDDELRAIWQATESPQPFPALIRFVLLTGCRRSEATGLRWSEVVNGIWTLPAARNKTKVDLTRPLSKAALAVVKTMPVIDSGGLVFSYDGQRPMHLSILTARLKAASGTSGWRIHDLRRSARTWLSRAGVDVDIAERCLGHSIRGVRGIYDRHDFEPEMRIAFEKLSTLISNITNPTDVRVVAMFQKG